MMPYATSSAASVTDAEAALRRAVTGAATAARLELLGVALLNVQQQHTFMQSLFYGFGAAVGFSIVLILFSGLRERINVADVPEVFQGTSISLITAGIMSLAFMGFSGLINL